MHEIIDECVKDSYYTVIFHSTKKSINTLYFPIDAA